jgi:site-specific DNA recombinase
MKLAVGYIRVSTDEQAREGVSLDMQITKIRQYCDLSNLTLIAIYGDPGISGKRAANRPGLQAVLTLASRNLIDHVVVYKLDRLARNTIETLEMIEAMDGQSVSLHSISEKLDTRSAIGRFVIRTLASLAEMERDQISERTTAALETKRANGERIGGQPPYGWTVVNGELVRNDTEQHILSRVNDLRSAGLSTRKIVDTLRAEGAVTRKGTPFTQTQICRILRAA